jgi:8-oxo-dGTP pyrophosphatase MutT (NUDIX family)
VTAVLAEWLQRHEPVCEETAVWLDGRVRLQVTLYLTADLPPLELVTSVRCLVFNGPDSVLVQRDISSTHILPGGRREPGESLTATLRREVLEETGWTLRDPVLLGSLHFRHLTPRPPDDNHPYPDFVQVIYAADADTFVPNAKLDDGHELDSRFASVDEVGQLELPEAQRLVLEAALRLRRPSAMGSKHGGER